MKTHLSFILLISVIIAFNSCNLQEEQKNDRLVYGQAKVEVFYFHRTRRCPQCLKIEEVVTEFIEAEYADKDVIYHSVDYENDENHEICSKYFISQSTLLITTHKENTDLTELALQVVMSDPEQLKTEMREIINSYLIIN
jgi:hypothetical protein